MALLEILVAATILTVGIVNAVAAALKCSELQQSTAAYSRAHNTSRDVLEQVRRHAMRDASASSLEELRELGQAQGGRGLDDPGAARRTGREDGRGDEQGEENEAGAHDEDSG